MAGLTLTEFLIARLDEDTATADGLGEQYAAMGPHIEGADRIRLHALLRVTAIRMLREVDAKRKIVAEYLEALSIQAGYKEVSSETANRKALEMACRSFAAIWSDHPDFDPAWKE